MIEIPTGEQHAQIFDEARSLFEAKASDYGNSWTILRPSSITDILYIKAARIRNIEEAGTQLVEDDIRDDYLAIINYCMMALILLEHPSSSSLNDCDEVLKLYDNERNRVVALMKNKNHDYAEVWRLLRISSITDLILMKILRIRSIEDGKAELLASENVDAGYRDMINYAIFALILLNELQNSPIH